MKEIKWISVLLVLSILLSLAGCGSEKGAVFVQSVADLQNLGGVAPGDLFAGLVVSEKVTEIQRDMDKSIEELLVHEGDDVKEGQKLFSYDTDQLQLTLDKQKLQLQQLDTSIENYEVQIFELEKEQLKASGRDKLEVTIQIQTIQVDWKEALVNQKNKEAEVAKTENLLQNATVLSPVTGRIQSINDTEQMDNNGRPLPYISIQEVGSYRVKGTLNELQRGGIMEGNRIRITSRTDASAVWYGTVTLVDYENPSQGNPNNPYGNAPDEMASSSRYPFYVELDQMDGLLLGQHVYLMIDTGEETAGLSLSGAFLCYEEDGSTFVWADNGRGKLEKRAVTLGDYNEMRDAYAVVEGLSEEDFIAFPDEELCRPGVSTTKTMPQAEHPEEEMIPVEGGV